MHQNRTNLSSGIFRRTEVLHGGNYYDPWFDGSIQRAGMGTVTAVRPQQPHVLKFPGIFGALSECDINCGNKECKNGLRPNRKYFIFMESGNLWTDGPNGLESRVIPDKHKTSLTTL
jgi:hypothetical protein